MGDGVTDITYSVPFDNKGGGRRIGGGGDRLLDFFDFDEDMEEAVKEDSGVVGLGYVSTAIAAEVARSGGYRC